MAKKKKEMEVAVAEVVDYLRMTGQFAPALGQVVGRKLTAQAAREKKIKVTTKELQKAADAFRAATGLSKASDTHEWLRSNGLSIEALEEYLETSVLVSKFKDQLNRKVAKTKYLSSPQIKESIREMVYRDWLTSEMG